MNTNVVCPVSKDKIDDNKARIIAFFVIVITGINLYFNNYYIAGLIALDYAIRAFSAGNASPLKCAATGISKLFRLNEKLINAAPKKFAAGVGMSFCLLIALFQFIQYFLVSQILGTMLVLCALLECAFGYCLGCEIYSFFYRFFRKNIN